MNNLTNSLAVLVNGHGYEAAGRQNEQNDRIQPEPEPSRRVEVREVRPSVIVYSPKEGI